MPRRNTVVVFAKNPVAGQVKTRLVGALSAQQASELHVACLQDTLQLVDSIPACDKRLLVATEFLEEAQPTAGLIPGLDWEIGLQQGPDLGARLQRAFTDLFRQGAPKAIVIGTDTPWMGRERLELAFNSLDSVDVTVGPTEDGGYYLIGARSPGLRDLPIFRNITWGTSQVCSLTCQALDRAHISYRLLQLDFDLDRPDDLWRASEIVRADRSQAEHLARWFESSKEAGAEVRSGI